MTTVKTKAKRKISKFNFEAEGSAVALVSASQGGAANSFKTLVIKSADKFSKEFIQKAQKVQVVMEFDDFLQKFFDMWKEDAKVLTSILGFGDEGMDSESELDDLGVYNDDYFYEWFDEKLTEEGATYRSPTEEDKLAWLEYRKQGITLVKSLAETDNKLEMLATLSEKDYWSVINEQKLFEKALKQKDLSGGEPTTPVVEAGKKRVRPAAMTTATTIIALLPVLSSTGKGADIMVPMSIPTFGGMLIQTMTMFVVPVFQCWWRESVLRKSQRAARKELVSIEKEKEE